jgi:hypothetical protein
MTKIIITGAKGRMGRALIACAPNFRELEIVGQIDVGDDLGAVIARGDVVVDFSSHTATVGVAEICAQHKKALVIGTTGHTDTDTFEIREREGANSHRLGVEFFDRREHAVLAHAQGGGNSGTGLRPGNRRNASSPEKGRAQRHGKIAGGNSGRRAQAAP